MSAVRYLANHRHHVGLTALLALAVALHLTLYDADHSFRWPFSVRMQPEFHNAHGGVPEQWYGDTALVKPGDHSPKGSCSTSEARIESRSATLGVALPRLAVASVECPGESRSSSSPSVRLIGPQRQALLQRFTL